MIFGVGVDIIEVDRIEAKLRRTPGLKDKLYTPVEIGYCESKKFPAQHYAARFAAKEAVMKALGTGLAGGGTWQDIEVLPDAQGKPVMSLTGYFENLAREMGVQRIFVSLSHAQEYAVAQVLLWRGEQE